MKKYTFLFILLSLPFFAVAQESSPRVQLAEYQNAMQRDKSEMTTFKMTVMRYEEACQIADEASIDVLKADLIKAMEIEIAQEQITADAKVTAQQQELFNQFSNTTFSTPEKARADNQLLHKFMQTMQAQLTINRKTAKSFSELYPEATRAYEKEMRGQK